MIEDMIQEMLGHSSLDMTLFVYSHVIPSMQLDAREKMQSLFQKLPDPEDKEV
jgi:integrase